MRTTRGLVPLLIASVLAGCTTAISTTAGPTTPGTATPGTATAGTATAGTATPTTAPASIGTASTARPSPSPEQRATADAHSILASFVAPPGARQLPGTPDQSGTLSQTMLLQARPLSHVVDAGGWWAAPGAPRAVLAWEQAHMPTRYSQADGGRETPRGQPTITFDTFSLPDIVGLLANRQLTVQAVADGKQTLLRVDAQVTWNPPRPASEAVPAAARVVTLTLVGAASSPAPVTITDPGKVRQIIALTNGLTLFPEFPLAPTCLGTSDGSVVLTFRATTGGPALAVATAQALGCRDVGFTIGGKFEPPLGGPRATPVFGARLLRVAGLDWKLTW